MNSIKKIILSIYSTHQISLDVSYLFIFFVILSSFTFIKAQETQVVICEGSCIGENLTPYEARRRALMSARTEAIKNVVGLEITEEIFRSVAEKNNINKQEIFDSFFRLTNTKSTGRIVREHILNWHTEIINNIPVYNVKIQATIVIDDLPDDPSFKVKVNLEKDVLYDGKDELSLKISASQDCYIFLFNLMANDSIQVILPNNYISNTFYDTKTEIQSFEKEIKKLGISFTVSLREGIKKDFEALYVVALKDKRDALSFPFQQFKPLSSIQAFADLQSWLINIPKHKRTESIKSYEIRNFDSSEATTYFNDVKINE